MKKGDEQVKKGVVKEVIRGLRKDKSEVDVDVFSASVLTDLKRIAIFNGALNKACEAIEKLPAEQIKSREQIERAIKYLENQTNNSWSAALLRCVLNQKQGVWEEEKIFGESGSGKVE